MRDHLIQTLETLAETDEKLYLMTGDLGFGVLNAFSEKFPDRFINAGISEQNMTAVAAGLALEGNTVYTYSIGNFPTLRCLEQIRNDVCYHNANVKIIVVGGGLSYGQLGMSHHATEDLAIMRALPGMRVFSPSDPREAQAVVAEAHRIDGPCYIRLGKGKEPDLHPAGPISDIYQAQRLREGRDVCILGTGSILGEGLQAAQTLEAQGISAAVYAFASVKPLDADAIRRCARRYRLLVSIEEHNRLGGFGGAVAEVLAEMPAHTPLLRIGLDDLYSSIVGSQSYLRAYYGLDGAHIAEKILHDWERMK